MYTPKIRRIHASKQMTLNYKAYAKQAYAKQVCSKLIQPRGYRNPS